MKSRVVWLVGSCLMAAILVLASCAPAVTEEEEEVVAPAEEEEKEVVVVEEGVTAEEEPQYGGIYALALSGWGSFDPAVPTNHELHLPVYEGLMRIDIARGPGGTNEIAMNSPTWASEFYAGNLAESWERIDLLHFTYTIRKGVRFQDKPPVNGREMTAEDVVFNWNSYLENPDSQYFAGGKPEEERIQLTIDPDDKWKINVRFDEPSALTWGPSEMLVFPPEIADFELENWTTMIGTGPFIVEDVVVGSSATFKRNPLYWQYDPFHPDNRLPYVGTLKMLVIPDVETRLAALRTGKLERLTGVNREDGALLQETDPELKARILQPFYAVIIDLQNNQEPFNDKKVRQAMHLAIDHPGIAEDYYEGDATILTWPTAEHAGLAYTPLEELPDELRELFEYHPDKARQLLVEAGYPDGFKTECLLMAGDIGLLSIVQSNLREVGIDMELKLLEEGTFWSMVLGHTVPQMSASAWGSYVYAPFSMAFASEDGKPHIWNFSYVIDEHINDTYDTMKATIDEVERARLYKELNLYALDQAFSIQLPIQNTYIFWQPWLKGYHGEYVAGGIDDTLVGIVKYVWIDQDMKYEMTGRR